MRRRSYLTPLLIIISLALLTVTVEMRPGHVYFILRFLTLEQGLLHLLAYLSLFLLAVTALAALLFNCSKKLRLLGRMLFSITLWISLSYRFSTGYGFQYADALTWLNTAHFALQALGEFVWQPILAALLTAVITFFLYVLGKRHARFPRSSAWMAAVAAVVVFISVHKTIGIVDHYPALFRVPVDLLDAKIQGVAEKERQSVIWQSGSSRYRHILLVVDESIGPDWMSINNEGLDTTPFLKSLGDSIQNYGRAVAFTNMSSGSNISLMSGAKMGQLPDLEQNMMSQPNIFQFAKAAGYRTVYLDAQTRGGVLQNFMGKAELDNIDTLIQPMDRAVRSEYFVRDQLLLEDLRNLLAQDRASFYYIVKAGAHWPYQNAYPSEGMEGTKVTHYKRAVKYAVDVFWESIWPMVRDRDDVLVVYTSDHGQDLTDRGLRINHASVEDASVAEGLVPLLLFNGEVGQVNEKDNYHHQQLFPSLLLGMGYDTAAVKSEFGQSVEDGSVQGPLFFVTGDVFGRGKSGKVLVGF